MTKSTQISPADSDLFRRTVGPVKCLRLNRVPIGRPPPAPVPKQTYLETQQVIQEMLFAPYDSAEIETGEELLFVQSSLSNGLLRKLRRGQFALEAQLDLHGMTVPVAKEALSKFLRECRNTRRRCVLIIHGKGNGSLQKQPVLKGKLNIWLQRCGNVLAFCSARPMDGGTGAVYVLIKRHS
jgi:DNA-nicking Smr family endonuclease